MCNGQGPMTKVIDHERRTRRWIVPLLVGLLLSYIGFKSLHIAVAVEAYRNQPLSVDTTGAAK